MAQSQQKQTTMGRGGRTKSRSINAIDQHVGQRVRAQRLLRGISQQTLAGALDLTFQQVQKYEKGTNRVSASRLLQIASVLHVTPAYFFENAPVMPGEKRIMSAAPTPDYVSQFLSTVEGLDLIKAFIRIRDPKLRRAIVALVKEIEPEKNARVF